MFKFIKKIFMDTICESGTEKISLGRSSFIAVLTVLLVIAVKIAAAEGILIDIPTNWMALLGMLYGINKVAAYGNKKLDNNK